MRAKAREAETLPLPIGINWWAPTMTWGAGYNAKLHETYLALSNEWQAFVGRRVAEDLHLLQQIGTARNPEQFWRVHTQFWQKAAEDYTQEYAVIAKLAATCVISGISVTEQAVRTPPEPAPPLPKAA